jgi:hypothetical protein
MSHSSARSATFAVVAAIILSACGETTTNPTPPATGGGSPLLAVGGGTPGVVDTGEFEVCKHGTAANFEYSVNGGPVTALSLADGGCAVLGATEVLGPGNFSVTVTELGDPAIVLDSIVPTTNIIFDPAGTRGAPITGTATFTALFNGDRGVLVEFYNSVAPPPPGGGEGCTPGYWKQSHHFDSWVGYTPNQLFSSVFENAYPGKTLLQVLSANGNSAGEALGRHTVAALLNASVGSGVSYDLTTADVINGFNNVWPGTKNALNGQKDIFEGFNTQGCPLN